MVIWEMASTASITSVKAILMLKSMIEKMYRLSKYPYSFSGFKKVYTGEKFKTF